jgi:hypothetical protein
MDILKDVWMVEVALSATLPLRLQPNPLFEIIVPPLSETALLLFPRSRERIPPEFTVTGPVPRVAGVVSVTPADKVPALTIVPPL